MLKSLTVAAWVMLGLDAVLVGMALISRDMGDDAAGRGVALALGLMGLGFLLLGGALLFFSGRAKSGWGVGGSLVFLALPFMLFFGADVEGLIHNAGVWVDNQKVGRYPEPAQRELATAIKAGNLDRMASILATHPNLQGRDAIGFDLLSFAVAQSGSVDPKADRDRTVTVVELLLDAGMDPNQARDPDDASVFVRLSRSVGDPISARIFQLFLDHGANPNALDGDGQPAVFHAWENPESVGALLDHGANIDIRGKDGDTPLLFYVYNGRWDAARLVLERGADLHVRNKYGTTLDLALKNQVEIAGRLHEPLSEGFHQVQAAIERRRAAEGRR
jgi:hypothetical protein